MKVSYQFSILRYIHDPVTQEFINIGVALYSPGVFFVGALCTSKYVRISKAFTAFDGTHFRRQTDYVQSRIDEYADRLKKDLPLESLPKNIEQITSAVLPKDDSSFQFSMQGSGLSSNPDATLEELFDRYVDKYYRLAERTTRTEDDVWRSFRQPLERKQVLAHLKEHTIVGSDYEHDFNYAWKNQQWHALQPLSFDLADGSYLLDKANTWLGRAQSLADAKEKFKLYFLMGSPADRKLRNAFDKAQNILHKMSVAHEFVKEDEAEGFADSLHKKIEEHGNK